MEDTTSKKKCVIEAKGLQISCPRGKHKERNWYTACSSIPWLARMPSLDAAMPTATPFRVISPWPMHDWTSKRFGHTLLKNHTTCMQVSSRKLPGFDDTQAVFCAQSSKVLIVGPCRGKHCGLLKKCHINPKWLWQAAGQPKTAHNICGCA